MNSFGEFSRESNSEFTLDPILGANRPASSLYEQTFTIIFYENTFFTRILSLRAHFLYEQAE